MSDSVLTDAQRHAAGHLDEADEKIDYQSNRLRAFAKSILALLPADPFHHPLLSPPGGPADDPLWNEKMDLRDNLIAAREIADAIDDVACMMSDNVSYSIEEARKVLGMPAAPGMIRTEEVQHA